jgi:ADP-ribose pyrophosphatase YjhB (NUDIX family)
VKWQYEEVPIPQIPQWLEWSRQLQAIAQTGLTYARDPYDAERYLAVRALAAEIMAAGAGIDNVAPLANLFAIDQGYCTPKVDVRAAVFDGLARLLLVREREDGLWTLPGGWADVGDAPSAATVREVKEESGYIVEAVKLAALWDRDCHDHPPMALHAYKAFFICRLMGGAAAVSYETTGVDFFAEDGLRSPPAG